MKNKPYAESCDQNRNDILDIIQPLLINSRSLLEIGSGTGQHAVYFTEQLPHITWYTSDRAENLEGIKLWLSDTDNEQLPPPIELDVRKKNWPEITFDTVFTANTCHIMNQQSVEVMIAQVGKHLPAGGQLIIYGPFNYNQKYTSASNEKFDRWLKERDKESAIRNFEDLNELAGKAGLNLVGDYQMPANNRVLCWRK